MIAGLWDHQVEAIDRLRASLMAGHRRVMLQAPTGSGKTRTAAEIISTATAKGNRAIFTVPMISLVDQTVEAFRREGIRDVGVMQGNHPLSDERQPVQVATIQTLESRYRTRGGKLPQAQLVLVDEAHALFEFLPKWMADPNWLTVPFIGLSATPWSRGLGKLYSDLIVVRTTEQLIEERFLSPFRVFAPTHPDLKGVHTRGGDYDKSELAEAMNKQALVADVVSTWLAKGENRPTLCFAVDRAHAMHLKRQFEAAGVPTGYVDFTVKREDRLEILARFGRGEIRVIVNVATLTTGVDQDVRCIILARPTKSKMLFVQMVGRGLRRAEGKADCLARDTLVLTDRGELQIQEVTLADRVWDGVSFVSHAGAVCKGVQPVITHDGLTATPDHEVMTDEGWLSLAEACRRRLRIARTGVGGRPLRFVGDRVDGDGRLRLKPEGRGTMRPVRQEPHGALSQSSEKARNAGLPALQWSGARHGAAMAVPAMPSAAGPVHELCQRLVRAVWRSWDRISLPWSERSGALDRGQSGCRGSIHADRPDQQQWALRARQSSLGNRQGEHEQSAAEAAEVWDIVSAGPRQRFTANGLLVHNCTILDHSDTTLRLGLVTDIKQDWLDDGKGRGPVEARAEQPLPKECPSCTFLKPPKVTLCPECGFKPERQSTIECEDGELVEITSGKGGKRRKLLSAQQRFELFGQLKWHVQRKGWKKGAAAMLFRELTGIFPDGVENAPPMRPGPEVSNWILSRNIRYAKGHGRGR